MFGLITAHTGGAQLFSAGKLCYSIKATSILSVHKRCATGIALSDEPLSLVGDKSRHEEDSDLDSTIKVPRYLTDPRRPTAFQRRKLAALLREQISDSSRTYDAIFTLSTTHMVKASQLPTWENLPLSASTGNLTVPRASRREKWLWRYPATVALHSFIRQARLNRSSHHVVSLTPAMLSLAHNALQFDSMMLAEILRRTGQMENPRWSYFFTRLKNYGTPAAAQPIFNEEKESEIVQEASETIDSFCRYQNEDGFPTSAGGTLDQTTTANISSIPIATLDLVFLLTSEVSRSDKVQDQTDTLTRLNLSVDMAALRLPRSPAHFQQSIRIALRLRRPDLGCISFSHWIQDHIIRMKDLGESPDDTQNAGLAKCWRRLNYTLRRGHDGRQFEENLHTKKLASVAALSSLAQEMWTRRNLGYVSASGDNDEVMLFNALLSFLASFPIGLLDEEITNPKEKVRTEYHQQVYDATRSTFRRIISDVLDESPELPAPGSFSNEKENPGLIFQKKEEPYQRLQGEEYITLVEYAINHVGSAEIAIELMGAMQRDGYRLDAETNRHINKLLANEPEVAQKLLESHSRNPQAITMNLLAFKDQSTVQSLETLVFSTLPELQVGSGSMAPPPKRKPHVYVTLLQALANSGKTGLAERVFINMKWAAVLSRKRKGAGLKSWVIPPAAFSIMFKVYAKEAYECHRLQELAYKDRLLSREMEQSENAREQWDKVERGRRENGRRVWSRPSRFARGFGKRAVKSWDLANRRKEEAAFGPGMERDIYRLPLQTSVEAPLLFRSEVAAIAAEYELDASLPLEDRRGLQMAMEMEECQGALDMLFPGRTPGKLNAAVMNRSAKANNADELMRRDFLHRIKEGPRGFARKAISRDEGVASYQTSKDK